MTPTAALAGMIADRERSDALLSAAPHPGRERRAGPPHPRHASGKGYGLWALERDALRSERWSGSRQAIVGCACGDGVHTFVEHVCAEFGSAPAPGNVGDA